MTEKHLRILVLINTVLSFFICDTDCWARTKKHLKHGSKQYFVPPPPPYSPSILPETSAIRAKPQLEEVQAQTPKVENPYRRYIYERDGYEAPQPVQPNKYVTYWNRT